MVSYRSIKISWVQDSKNTTRTDNLRNIWRNEEKRVKYINKLKKGPYTVDVRQIKYLCIQYFIITPIIIAFIIYVNHICCNLLFDLIIFAIFFLVLFHFHLHPLLIVCFMIPYPSLSHQTLLSPPSPFLMYLLYTMSYLLSTTTFDKCQEVVSTQYQQRERTLYPRPSTIWHISERGYQRIFFADDGTSSYKDNYDDACCLIIGLIHW